MKLAAIFNVWADWDWLNISVNHISPVVDGIIVIWSEKSNYGEVCEPYPMLAVWGTVTSPIVVHVYRKEPALIHPMHEETARRNFGLQKARELGYTHFLSIDCDELYDPEQFHKEKQRFIDNPNLAGLVCASQVYVKSPTLTIGLDTTLVPFIHKITPTLKHSFNRMYPFSWDKGQIKIDPTRSLNIDRGVEWSPIVMDHYSWVRSDIARKVRNSTAKANIEKTEVVKNFFRLTEGSICEIYPGKPLVRVPNKYGLPEFDGMVQDLQRGAEPLPSTGSKE